LAPEAELTGTLSDVEESDEAEEADEQQGENEEESADDKGNEEVPAEPDDLEYMHEEENNS
jgi:hypothetical protein